MGHVTTGSGLTAEAEARRLAALQEYAVLDSAPEQDYEDITKLASYICGTPISLISLVDEHRQWFKSERGLGVKETPRSHSFCANTLEDGKTLIVEDAASDERFKNNPLVLGNPNIRFYAGAPIIQKNGEVLGTVCVIDTHPRVLSRDQIDALEALARQVVVLLEQRKLISSLEGVISETRVQDLLLHESKRQLQSFVDSFPTLGWMANADGYITWYNQRWYDYTGTTPREMEGWGWQSVHDPNVLPSVMERWTKSIETKEPFEMIFPVRGADGVFRSFMTRVVPVRDESGEVIQWFGSNTEVDELHRTRRALELSEAGLKQVMTATSDAVVSIDRNWLLTYLNPMAEQLYGQAEDLIGRNLWEAFPDAMYEGSPFVEHCERAMDEGVAGSFEAEFGEHQSVTLGLEVYPSKEGIVVFSRDITKMKHATAAILQNEKLAAVGRLASSISHEINNPLEAVTNLLYLARVSSPTKEVDEYLEGAERELRRVSNITNLTLRFFKQMTKPTAVTCVDLFRDTIQLYQGKLLNSNIEVEQRTRASRPAICLEGEIRQVLSNLIGNAIDAMPEGGRLILRSRDSVDWKTGDNGIQLTVADTGCGMVPAIRKKVFEAFFSTKGIGGTGLGLWVSQEIVDRHHGRLRVRSSVREHGHGTVFSLFLPFDVRLNQTQSRESIDVQS